MHAGNCDIEHLVLRARARDEDEGAGFRDGFQPAHDDHSRDHGLIHPSREDLPRRVSVCVHLV